MTCFVGHVCVNMLGVVFSVHTSVSSDISTGSAHVIVVGVIHVSVL